MSPAGHYQTDTGAVEVAADQGQKWSVLLVENSDPAFPVYQQLGEKTGLPKHKDIPQLGFTLSYQQGSSEEEVGPCHHLVLHQQKLNKYPNSEGWTLSQDFLGETEHGKDVPEWSSYVGHSPPPTPTT